MSSELTKDEAASNIFAAYAKAFRNYFGFSGRTCRYDYWGFAFVNFIILFLLGLVNQIGSNIYSSVMFIPCLAIFVRRLHDINKGFWKWAVFLPLGCFSIVGVICVIFIALGTKFGMDTSILTGLCYAIAFVAILIWCIMIIVFICRKGNPEKNKFGNPIDEDESHDKRAKWMIFFVIVVPVILQGFLLTAGGLAGYNKAMQNIQEQQQQQLQSDIKVPQVQASEVNNDAQESEPDNVEQKQEAQEPETDNIVQEQEAQEAETNDVMQEQKAPAEVEEAEAEDAEESGETEKTEEAEE